MKNMKMRTKICTTIFITLIVGLSVLWFFANQRMTSAMRESTVARLAEASESHTAIIDQYLDNAEAFFQQYGQSDAVINLLKNPSDKKLQDIAFAYSDRYAATEKNLEGLYIADMDTKFLYHNNRTAIGNLVRPEEERRNQLISVLFSSNAVYSAGILASTASGKQVIADYYPIYDENGKGIGMVGGGILADQLMNQLDGLEMKGLEKSKYLLLDLNKNCYIFCTDSDFIGTKIEDENYLEIAKQIKENPEIETATYEFKDTTTKENTIAVYKNMSDKGWAFVLLDSVDEVYRPVYKISNALFIICLAVLLLIAIVGYVIVQVISKDLVKIGKIIGEIGNLDLTKSQKLNVYNNRKDEVGIIANATMKLSKAISDAVLVLKDKESELQENSATLLETSKQTSDSVTQVDSAIQEIAMGATNQAAETERASSAIFEIGNEITDTVTHSNAIRNSATQMKDSSSQAVSSLEKLNDINKEAVESIHLIYEQTNNTNQSAQKIKEATSLITSISEETNLLSLNASIEAARAGEQGRGFAVVASQIQKLAEQSNNSAIQIDNIINSLISDSMKAVETMEKVTNIMNEQSECVDSTKVIFTDVKTKIDDMLGRVNQITDRISNIDEDRAKIVDVVQGLSAIAEENAASAEETSASTSLVNEMTSKISNSASELKDIATEISDQVGIFTV